MNDERCFCQNFALPHKLNLDDSMVVCVHTDDLPLTRLASETFEPSKSINF